METGSKLECLAVFCINFQVNEDFRMDWMFIWTQFIDQLPVGLLAQLVERCTGIAEVMGSNPVRA